MNILFFGDIVGRPGRLALQKMLPDLVTKTESDFVIANGDNLEGVGHTAESVNELLSAGVDLVTSGNHWNSKKDFFNESANNNLPFIRPANFEAGSAGSGYRIVQVRTKKILVINLIGQVLMNQKVDNPFKKFDQIMQETKFENPDVIIVDFHAEATAEKNALGLYLDGQISAMLGSHTHVPTADAVIMTKGTGYISDVGMVGARHSVIGFEPQQFIQARLTDEPIRLEVPEPDEVCVNYAVVHTNDENGHKPEKCGAILQRTEVLKLD